MYAKHSIYYQHLKSYFYVFSIWNDKNVALSWQDTCDYAALLGLQVVPVLCSGVFDSIEDMRKPIDENLKKHSETNSDEIEGYVIRLAGPISYRDFRISTAKTVRKNHVQSPENWMTQAVIPNKIKV
jgi:tRNA splicing ligase